MRAAKPSAAASSATIAKAGDPIARRYLYCVIRSREPLTFAAPGVAGEEHIVHTVNHRDLAAVVSASSVETYESTRRNMTSHMRVLEEVMRDHPILPIQFNKVAPNIDEIVNRILAPNHDTLIARLDNVAGRVEMGVKAYWREDVLYQEIVRENDAIRRLRDRVEGRSPDAVYRERIKLGELVEKALLAKRQRESAEMIARLKPHAESVRLHEPVTDRMALNAALFVKKADQPAFEQSLNALDEELNKRVLFKCVGPVPPYNFVELTLG